MTTQEFAMAQIVLDVIKREAVHGGMGLTAGEVARACNISRNSAAKHLNTLIKHDEVRMNYYIGKNQSYWKYYRLATDEEKSMDDIPF